MFGIKFNAKTKEIEIRGPESFIEAHFDKISELIVGTRGASEAKKAERPGEKEERIIFVDTIEEPEEMETAAVAEASPPPEIPLAATPETPEVSLEQRVKRPPVRKYIRKDGISIVSKEQSPDLDKPQQVPAGISIASLKEKFGLSEQQIGVMIREAEREGRVRRDPDGSYVWI